MFERSRKGEHALLIQPHAGGRPDDGLTEEFSDLARSAGASIAALLTARIDRPNPSTLIGSGKLEEVKAAADATGADLILVNHALSPGQERNLERFLERRVIDRTGLILDIFAQRAHSHDGKLQVELAQLRHMATRLVRGWTHLERQRGGSIGLRGPGETQLETDHRLLQKRVEQLQKRLEKVEVQRTQMRRARVRSELPRVALVGYTNAGKSTLFNALTETQAAQAANYPFCTIEPNVGIVELASQPNWGDLPVDKLKGIRVSGQTTVDRAAGKAPVVSSAEARIFRQGLNLLSLKLRQPLALDGSKPTGVLVEAAARDLPLESLSAVVPGLKLTGDLKRADLVAGFSREGLFVRTEGAPLSFTRTSVTWTGKLWVKDCDLAASLDLLVGEKSTLIGFNQAELKNRGRTLASGDIKLGLGDAGTTLKLEGDLGALAEQPFAGPLNIVTGGQYRATADRTQAGSGTPFGHGRRPGALFLKPLKRFTE